MGEWQAFVPYQKPHFHQWPDFLDRMVPDIKDVPHPGSVWVCECGERFIVSAVTHKRRQSGPVKTWLVYGKKFGFYKLA